MAMRSDKSEDAWDHRNPLEVMSFADIANTKLKADAQANQGQGPAQGYRARLGTEKGIPWYIIDPTGRIVNRAMMAERDMMPMPGKMP